MKRIQFFAILFLSLSCSYLFAQKTISEGTITYDIVIHTDNKEPQMADALDGATTTVYLKGSQSRTEMVSALGNESTVHDTKSGDAFILKDYSGQKLMITLTKENWLAKNKKYEGVNFKDETETKNIAGYNCKKATATLKDGSTIIVFYASDLNVINKDYDQTFKSLPGLPMQYEFSRGKMKFKYTVSKVDFNPVPASKFEMPKSNYRVMTYDENQQGGK